MENPELKIRSLLDDEERKQTLARERMSALSHEIAMRGAAIDAYRAALAAFSSVVPRSSQPARQAGDVVRKNTKSSATIPGGEKWMEVFSRMVRDSDAPYGYQDIEAAITSLGREVSIGAIRAQMMNVVNANIFCRVGPGKFTLTDAGLEIFTSPQEDVAIPVAAIGNAEEGYDLLGALNPNPAPTGA